MMQLSLVLCLYTVLLETKRGMCSTSSCNISEFNATSYENFTENADVTTGLQLNTSDLKTSEYRIDIKICDNGSLETVCDCASIPNFKVSCRNLNGHNIACFHDGINSFKLTLSAKRVYTDIVWEKFVQNSASVVLKHTKMQVLYAPSIESLQVDKKNITEKGHLVNKGQKVTITCSFDSGNPPAIFHLFKNEGQILSSNQTGQGRLDYTLVVDDCSDVWPIIRCQAVGSNLYRSVAILVRCSPRFLEAPDYANILDPQVTFSLRSHTTNLSNCRVAKFTPRAGREKKVNCSISGTPPELVLTLPLHRQPWVEEGKWKLAIENELGTSETLISLTSKESVICKSDQDENFRVRFDCSSRKNEKCLENGFRLTLKFNCRRCETINNKEAIY